MSIEKNALGTLPNGTAVTRYTLSNGTLSVSVLDYGATIQSIVYGGVDVVLGFASAADYATVNKNYLGATVGRYANRIKDGKFTLNGKTYTLAKNNGANHLHGGDVGFDKKMWDMTATDGDAPQLRARCVSPDGEEGYPGTLTLTVTFTLRGSALSIVYDAVSDADTVANFTNHAYFNLAGKGDILDTLVTVHADAYTATDDGLIPLAVTPVDGTPLDMRKEVRLGDVIRSDEPSIKRCKGLDHNFVLQNYTGALRTVMTAKNTESGIAVACATDLPGVQIYSGNDLAMPVGKNGPIGAYAGFCMETQFFPDTPNRPDFPSCVLRAGEPFSSETVYTFSRI